MRSKNLYLGIVLVVVGVIALLASLDVINFSWAIAWRLWPLLLIFAGISVLPVKDWLKAILILSALAVGVLFYQYEANHNEHWLFSQIVGKESDELPVA